MKLTESNLTIRNAAAADAQLLCEWWNDGKIMAHAGFPNGIGTTAEEVRTRLAADTDETRRRHIIELDGVPIGEMNYRNMGHGTAQIGIKICDFTVHYKGFGTRILAVFIDALFTHYGYSKIILDTNANNERAQHVYENKLGFTKLRVNENSWQDQLGEWQSSVDYELTRAAWANFSAELVPAYEIDVLFNDRFPRSNKYEAAWIFKNQMGPHPLWLTEFLAESMNLKARMRVLDLACGKGMTSVFLAREYGVQVYAVDFDEWEGWTSTQERWENAKEYGVEDLVIPVKADARNLPFAPDFFDAIICVDGYIYFGADDSYLQNILRFLRPGGQIGMIVPGYMKDVSDGIPDYITEFLGDELWTWQTLGWWRSLWEKDGLVTIDTADTVPNGCDLWLRWDTALLNSGMSQWSDETEFFRTDNGEYMGFIRLIGTSSRS